MHVLRAVSIAAMFLGLILAACGGRHSSVLPDNAIGQDVSSQAMTAMSTPVPVPQSESLYVASRAIVGPDLVVTDVSAYDIVTGAKTFIRGFFRGNDVKEPVIFDGPLAVSNDRSHLLWDVARGLIAWDWARQRYSSNPVPNDYCGSYAISGDGLRVVQACEENAPAFKLFLRIQTLGGCAAFLCDLRDLDQANAGHVGLDQTGETVYQILSNRPTLQTLDSTTGAVLHTLRLPSDVNVFIVDQATHQIYAASRFLREIYVVDLLTNTLLGHIFEDRGKISTFAISRDGTSLYTLFGAWVTKYAIHPDGRSYKAREYRIPWAATVLSEMAVSADGKYVFVNAGGLSDGLPIPTIQLDTVSGKIVRFIPFPTRFYRLVALGER